MTSPHSQESDREGRAYYPAYGHGDYPSAMDDGGDGLDLRGVLRFLRRRKALILSVTAVGTVVAGLVGHNRVPTFTAEALLMIQGEKRIVELGATLDDVSKDVAGIETEVNLIKSHSFINELGERLFHREIEAAPLQDTIAETRPEESLVAYLWEDIARRLPENWLIASGVATEPTRVSPEEARASARAEIAEKLEKDLEVRQVGRSFVISISYSSPSPSEAARVANGMAQLYIDDQLGQKKALTGRASEFLEKRVLELEQEVREGEQKIQAYLEEHKALDSTASGANNQQMLELTNMMVDARAQRKERESRLAFIRELQGKGESLESLSEVLQSPYIVTLWQQEAALRRQEAELRGVFGEKHPAILNIVNEQQEIRDRVDVEISRIVANIENELRILREREKSVQSEMDSVVAKSGDAGVSEIELRRLEREAAATRQIYENFLQRFKETREQQELAGASARIIAQAAVPALPSSRSPNTFVLIGFVLSSALGVLLGFLREKLDNGVRSGKEVELALGVPCLGLVPYLAPRQRNHKKLHEYLLAKPLSTYTETIRSLYTALRLSDVDRPPQVIQVTSSVPGEGKTTLAVSLAAALALDGKRTILIDGDMRHPSVRRELETPGRCCLVTYLTGDCRYEEAVKTGVAGGIDVIDVRKTPPNPSRLLASKRMADLIMLLRSTYDYIVIDGPPVLGVSDSKVIMELSDTVLYAVRWERTTMDTAADAVKEMRACGAEIAGAVITQVDLARHAQYGYGGIDAYYNTYKKYYAN